MSQIENKTEPFRTLDHKYLFQSRWRSFRLDRVDVGEGREIIYSYAETAFAIWVVPLTVDGNIVLINQYRYPVRDWLLEVPAGALDTPDEDPVQAALRELKEEIGGTCEEIKLLTTFYSSAANADLKGQIYLATGVTLGERNLGENEILEPLIVPAEQAFAMARRGEIADGQSAYALFLAEPHVLAHLESLKSQ